MSSLIYRVLKRKRFQGRRIIKTKQWKKQRYRRWVEPRSLFAKSISNLYTKHLPKNSFQVSTLYTSVALCAVGISVILHYLRPLRDSVCLLYKRFSLSVHISEEPKKIQDKHTKKPELIEKSYLSLNQFGPCSLSKYQLSFTY